MLLTPQNNNLGKIKITELPRMALGARSHEEDVKNRVGFLIRKDNSITFKIRYRYTNVNQHSGKQYNKWNTLNMFSATINEKNRLNLFFSGATRKARTYQTIINITRQPYILTGAYDSDNNELFSLFSQEIIALFERNNLVHEFSGNPANFIRELMFTAYPAWKTIVGDKDYLECPPLYATEALRGSFEEFIETITAPTENKLQLLIRNHPSQVLDFINIFKLMVSKKRINEEDRITSLHFNSIILKAKHTVESPAWGVDYRDYPANDLSFQNLMHIRSLLKIIPAEQRFTIIESSCAPPFAISEIASDFSKLKKLSINIQLAVPKEPSWSDIEKQVKGTLANYYHKSTSITELENQFTASLRKACLATEFYSEKSWPKGQIITAIGPYSSNVDFPIFNRLAYKNNQSATGYVLSNINANNYHSVKKNDFIKTYYYKTLESLDLQSRYNSESGEAVLSFEEYKRFIDQLVINATAILKKKKLEASALNIWHYLAVSHLCTYNWNLSRFRGFVPAKWFTLLKHGHSPEMTLYYLEKRILNKDVKDWVDMPDDWTKEVLGITNDKAVIDFF